MRENGRPKRKGGQALAEMAVMVPFLVIGMMGFLDLGRAFYYQISLTNAVREATRYGIQNAYFGLAPACVIPTNLGPSCPVPPDDAICAHVVQELAGSGFNVTCPGDVTILPDQQGRFMGKRLPAEHPVLKQLHRGPSADPVSADGSRHIQVPLHHPHHQQPDW